MTSVKWLAIAALLASGVLFWSGLAPFGVVARFSVAFVVIAVVLQVLQSRKRHTSRIASRATLTAMFVLGAVSAATPADLSKYRKFELGTDLATVAAQTGGTPAQAKLIAARPARVQELEWSPQSSDPSYQTESAKSVLFSFYNDQLYQITVDYDRYKTEGLTANDIAEAISKAYGTDATHPLPAKEADGSYTIPAEVVARWEDAQYRIDLIRMRYGPPFRLIATVKRLEAPVEASLLEAKRLDDQEAPQREAARAADEAQSERARLEKIRLVNKPKFRP
jgi:hypothetical protein